MTARHTAATSPLVLDGEHGALTIARDTVGNIARIDLRSGPHGTTLSGLADALGSALTLALRAGAPADVLLARRVGGAPVPGPRPAPADDAAHSCAPALHTALTASLAAAAR